MMKFLFFALFIQLNVMGQGPAQLLNTWSARSPIEKVYLHLDRENYMAGETVWLKAYLYSEYLPDTISTSLYVELLDHSSTIIQRKIMPVVFGSSWGQLELVDTLRTGSYFIRAYTHTMMNHDPEFIYKRAIDVFGKPAPASKLS